jgi:hypothetical protein
MRLDHGSDIAVFQNQALAVLCLSEHNIHHCPGQIIGANDLVREQNPEYRIDRAQQPVAEVRFVPRLNGVDIRRPEKVNMRETRCQHCVLSLSLVAREGKPASSCRVGAVSA